jgi:hypothetical protein
LGTHHTFPVKYDAFFFSGEKYTCILDNEVVNNKVHYPVATRVNGAASQVIIHLFAYPSAKQGIKKVQYMG